MLNYKNKPVESLNFAECIEFEKELLKKVLAAGRAGMSDDLIDQLNMYISIVRMYKKEVLQKEIDNFKDDESADGISLDTGIDE